MKNGRERHLHQKRNLKMEVTAKAIVHLTTVKAVMALILHTVVATVHSVLVSIVTNVLPIVQMAYRMNVASVQQASVVHLPRRVASSQVVISLVRVVISLVRVVTSVVATMVATTSVVAISNVVAISLVRVATTPIVVISLVANSRRVASNSRAISLVRVAISSVVATISVVAISKVAVAVTTSVVVISKVAVVVITNQRGGYQQGGRGGYNQRGGYNPNAKYSMKKQIEYKEYLEDPNAPIRLNKFLANAGVCSRREADQFIQAGVVSVNGQVVTELGTKVQRTDQVHFHDQLVSIEKKVYVILNKPKDYVTTSDDPQQRKTVMELVKNCCRERIYPVGRLDRNTTGVLLFTNDGDLASKLTHPKFLKKKIYHVHLDKNLTAADMKQIAEGIMLEDGEIKADDISYASETDHKQVGIEIHSGKNRIVRRIFESLGYKVTRLDRVVFAGLTKKGIKRGDWRFLTEQEVAMLHTGHYE